MPLWLCFLTMRVGGGQFTAQETAPQSQRLWLLPVSPSGRWDDLVGISSCVYLRHHRDSLIPVVSFTYRVTWDLFGDQLEP